MEHSHQKQEIPPLSTGLPGPRRRHSEQALPEKEREVTPSNPELEGDVTKARIREEVLQRLQQQAHRQQRSSRLFMFLYWVGLLAFLVCQVAKVSGWFALDSLYIMLFGFGYAAAIFTVLWVGSRWKRTTDELAKSADVRAVGPLVEGLTMAYQSNIARDALLPLLPRLKADDAHLLGAEHRRILNQVLGRPTLLQKQNVPLVLAILKAYEQVGDSEAIPIVERLAAGKGYAAKSFRVREAARACLEFLRPRAEREVAQQTLLRAASVSDRTSDGLLHPVLEPSPAAQEQLLRASEEGTAQETT